MEDRNVFFKGYTRTGKRADVVLKDGRIYIVYTASGIARKWNDEYYTEDSYQLVRDSFVAEGFRIVSD